MKHIAFISLMILLVGCSKEDLGTRDKLKAHKWYLDKYQETDGSGNTSTFYVDSRNEHTFFYQDNGRCTESYQGGTQSSYDWYLSQVDGSDFLNFKGSAWKIETLTDDDLIIRNYTEIPYVKRYLKKKLKKNKNKK